MFNRPNNNQRTQKLARWAASWFICFAILVPVFHRHVGAFTASPVALGAVNHLHATVSGATTHGQQKTLSAQFIGDDDCALCDWFAVGFTTPTATCFLLFIATATALLVLSVRLLALCRRPLPRRGLRAPPVFIS